MATSSSVHDAQNFVCTAEKVKGQAAAHLHRHLLPAGGRRQQLAVCLQILDFRF